MIACGFIYTLSHPETHEIRYIGQTKKGLKKRLSTHINSSIREYSNESKTPIGKWIKKLHLEKLKPIISILKEVPIIELDNSEIACIKDGKNRYRLLNIASGGRIEGRKKGSKQTAEFCERQSRERSGIKNQNFKNLTGKKYNKLTVIKLERFWNHRSWWLCQCECGKTKIVSSQKIGRTLSCGCARKTRIISQATRKLLSEINKKNNNVKYLVEARRRKIGNIV